MGMGIKIWVLAWVYKYGYINISIKIWMGIKVYMGKKIYGYKIWVWV